MADQGDYPSLHQVVRETMDAWRMGYDPADTGPTMAEAIADALLSLPVEHRMRAMGMRPVADNRLMWTEASRG